MKNESETKDASDSVKERDQKAQPWLNIGDDEIYILNPLYHLSNYKRGVLAQGASGIPSELVHRAVGVILALCNGKRTVADIAKITRPLVKISDDIKATEIAKENVKLLIHPLTMTREERQGQPPQKPDGEKMRGAPLLITKADFEQNFSSTKFKRIEYCAHDFLPKDETEMPGPLVYERKATVVNLNWHLTSDCSTDCRYCYLGRRNVKPMPKTRALSLIEEAAAIGVVELLVSGGDFLLYPYLEDFLAAMCKHDFLPTPFCTKSFLSKEKAKVLAEAASVVLDLQFSIDSTVPDVADYLVRAKGFCDRIFKSIDNALEAGIRVEAKAVITPYNILTIPQLYRDLRKRGVSTVRLAAYCRSGFHHTDDLFNHVASFRWLEEQTELLKKEFPDDYINIQNGAPCLEPDSRELKQRNWKENPKACSAGRTSMMICADGKVIPCEQMPETEEYFCGDVSYQSIQDVWDGDRLRKLTYGIPREKFKGRGQVCYDCDKWEECIITKGNCIRDLAQYYGNIYLPSPNCPKHNPRYIRIY